MRLKDRGASREEAEKLTHGRPDLDPITIGVVTNILRCQTDCGPNRAMGFGVMGCIPKDAVFWWCGQEGLDRETAEDYWRVIQMLDSERVEREQSKARLNKRTKKK